MTLTVDHRFRGPTTSGNGGYVCGSVAAAIDDTAAVTVTLRTPPPLDTALSFVEVAGGLRLHHGDTLVAEATRSAGDVDLDPVPPIDLEAADAATSHYAGLLRHPFPECFVCGPSREAGDGMRLFPGRLGDGRTACVWTVGADLAGRPEFVWAALDCPGGWTAPIEGRPMVLGRMTAAVSAAPEPGERCVVMGRLLGSEGRKTWTATTVYAPGGAVLGRAQATWIALPEAS